MTAKEIIVKLYNLHELRKEMKPDSIYHGVYEERAIKLNQQLRSELGIDYVDLTQSQINKIIGLNLLFKPSAIEKLGIEI